jgi:hypothetical protein
MKLVKFTGQLYDIRMKRHGGGRVTIDFGGDAFEEMLEVQRFFKDNNINIAMALVPYQEPNQDQPDQSTQIEIEEYLK